MNIYFGWCDRSLRGFWHWVNAKIFFDFYRYSIVDGLWAVAMTISRSLSLGLNKPFVLTVKFSHQINRLHWRIQLEVLVTHPLLSLIYLLILSFSCSFWGKFAKLRCHFWGWRPRLVNPGSVTAKFKPSISIIN